MAQGGHGVISVMANIAPKMTSDLVNAFENGDLETVSILRDKLVLLGTDLFCESNPAPVKYALSKMGLCSDEVRLPLLPCSDAGRMKVDAAMAHAGLS